MNLNSILLLRAALQALDGQTKLIRDDGAEKLVQLPYTFSSGTRFSLARNLYITEPHAMAYDKTLRDVTKEIEAYYAISDSNRPDVSRAQINSEVSDRMRLILNEDINIEFVEINQHDLQLDKNEIPPSIIAALMPIILS